MNRTKLEMNALRQEAVKCFSSGMSQKATSDALGVSTPTMCKWHKAWKNAPDVFNTLAEITRPSYPISDNETIVRLRAEALAE